MAAKRRGSPYQRSKKNARAQRRIEDIGRKRVNKVQSELSRIYELAQRIRDRAHLTEILREDKSISVEMRESLYKLMEPMLPNPDGEPLIKLTDPDSQMVTL